MDEFQDLSIQFGQVLKAKNFNSCCILLPLSCNLADDEVRNKIKTIPGCSRFIEGQNVISANIMRRTAEINLGCFSYSVAEKSFKNRVLYY